MYKQKFVGKDDTDSTTTLVFGFYGDVLYFLDDNTLQIAVNDWSSGRPTIEQYRYSFLKDHLAEEFKLAVEWSMDETKHMPIGLCNFY